MQFLMKAFSRLLASLLIRGSGKNCDYAVAE